MSIVRVSGLPLTRSPSEAPAPSAKGFLVSWVAASPFRLAVASCSSSAGATRWHFFGVPNLAFKANGLAL
jgi:hypothetical protein